MTQTHLTRENYRPDPLLRTIRVLQGVIVGAIVVAVLLVGSAVVASADDQPFYFDESGQMQQHGYWSPNNRSRSDFDTDRRMYNQYQNQEVMKQNEALIDSYYSHKPELSHRQPTAPPAYGSGSLNDQFLYFPSPGSAPRLCSRAGQAVYCN